MGRVESIEGDNSIVGLLPLAEANPPGPSLVLDIDPEVGCFCFGVGFFPVLKLKGEHPYL